MGDSVNHLSSNEVRARPEGPGLPVLKILRVKFRSLSKALFAIALLTAMLGYSFDFECLLESQDCHQSQTQVSSQICVQPSLSDTASYRVAFIPAILPPAPRVSISAPSLILIDELAFERYHQPFPQECSVPLGLRAPPLLTS